LGHGQPEYPSPTPLIYRLFTTIYSDSTQPFKYYYNHD
jgi:hypothetical protein